ncbi:MAG TPA: peptidoglycan DD-metalloendopeptidase family protein [Patescibacteria group bacterium]
MNKSVGNFLFQASQFFATNPRETAYKDIFPKDHMLSLFFKRQEFRKKLLEKNEDVEKRKDKQMQRIKQTLQTISSTPEEIPSVSPEAENIVSEYATLTQAKDLGGIDQEQINARKGQIDQKFNGFIDKNPAPLSALTNFALQKAGGKIAEAAATKAVAAVATGINPALGAIVTFISKEVISRVITWLAKNKERFFEVLGGGMILGGILVGGTGGSVLAVAGAGVGAAGVISAAGGVSAAAGTLGAAFFTFVGAILGTIIAAIIIPLTIAFIAIPIITVLILFIINSGAYVVPPAPSLSGTSGSSTLGITISSPYIDVVKTASPAGPFENSALTNGLTIKYDVTVRAKKGALSNLKFENTCQQVKKGGSAVCDAQIPSKDAMPQFVDPGKPYTFSYSETYFSPSFEDSFVVDTFKVTADAVPEKTGAIAAASAVVKIGKPPEDCPSGWPVDGDIVITQGPNGSLSHYGYQAIDISKPALTPIHATHAGTVISQYWEVSYGHHVRIVSSCNGKTFESVYGHMDTIAVKTGDFVAPGEIIGTIDNTGRSSGNHLHYEFRPVTPGSNDGPVFPQSNQPLLMNPPYIPKSVQ